MGRSASDMFVAHPLAGTSLRQHTSSIFLQSVSRQRNSSPRLREVTVAAQPTRKDRTRSVRCGLPSQQSRNTLPWTSLDCNIQLEEQAALNTNLQFQKHSKQQYQIRPGPVCSALGAAD